MKLNEYLESLRKEDPEFDKWFKENWIAWTPPKRKVKIFLDRNLPQELKNEIISYPKFKAFEEVQTGRRPDEDIYSYCYRTNLLILTLDKDFWDDKRFPLAKSPGVILIASSPNLSVSDCIESLAVFLVYFDLIGGIRRFPDFAKRMKFKISLKGFVLKFVAYNGKPETVNIDY